VCWFITVGVPILSRHLLEQLRLEQGVLDVTYLDSTPTSKLFGPSYVCAVITSGGCSCDLVAYTPVDPGVELGKHEARLRKRGLSEAKIRQALEAKAHALTKSHPSDVARDLFAKAAWQIASKERRTLFYSHSYHGNIHTEAVPKPELATVSLHSIEGTGFPPDKLVSVGAVA
jgi:hypothetical protein